MATVSIDSKSFEKVVDAIQKFGEGAEAEINKYLPGEGGEVIKKNIQSRLPTSGRTWSGKSPAAKSIDPFRKIGANLAVEVLATNAYKYLYFPDDGSSTKNHYGGQEFMQRGAEDSTEEITDNIINKILQKF